METSNQTSMNQLYDHAQKRGFRGSFSKFVEEYNSLQSKMIPEDKVVSQETYFNDKGGVPTQQQQQQPVFEQQQQPQYQPPVYQERAAPAMERPQPNLPDIKKDDKILGMNKWLFAGLCTVAVLGVSATIYFVVRSSKKGGSNLPPVQGSQNNTQTSTPAQPGAAPAN